MKKFLAIILLFSFACLQSCFFGGDVNEGLPGDDFVVDWDGLKKDCRWLVTSIFGQRQEKNHRKNHRYFTAGDRARRLRAGRGK